MTAVSGQLYPKSDNANAGAPFSPNDNAGNGWTVNPGYSIVDDPKGSPDDSAGNYGYETAVFSVTTHMSAEWDLTAPPSGVTITDLTITARLNASSLNANTHTLTNIKAFVRPGGVGTRDKKTLGSGSLVSGTGASPTGWTVMVTVPWTVNPNTGIAWTIPDLQSLVIGIQWDDIDSGGSSIPLGYVSQVYVDWTGTTIAQTTERFRAMGSAVLRMLRKPFEPTTVITDAEFADISPGDPFVVDHQLGPAAGAAQAIALTPAIGWGKQKWSRRDHICFGNTLHPELLEVDVEGWDARAFRARLWAVFKHDLGYSDEAQGMVWLDSGGGRTFTRPAQAGYVLKQSQDILYAQVPADFPKWDTEGLRIEDGGDTNRILNSSFSQGSGTTFTNWTWSGAGTIVEDLVNFLFDAAGLRRACRLTQGANTTGFMTAAATAATSDAYIRIRAIGRMLAAASAGLGIPQVRVSRSSDGKYWNDTTGTWDVATTNNVIAPGTVGGFDWASKLIPTSGSNTYTALLGFFGTNGLGTGASVVLQEFEITTGTQAQMVAIRSPLVTTTAAVTRVADSLLAQNNAAARWWDASTRGGTVFVRLKTLWAHSDSADGDYRWMLFMGTIGLKTEFMGYRRVNSGLGEWVFRRRFDGSTVYDAVVQVSGAQFPTYLSEKKVAFRWIGPDQELGLPAYTLTMFAEGISGSTLGVAQDIATNTDVLFSAITFGLHDNIIAEVESVDFCLTDDEIAARLG